VSRVDDIRRTAEQVFGWPTLRPGQLEAMEAVVAGRDVLVVMPTGAGKSAVYQVPAVLVEGPTVVVSPLIALQRDQVTGLTDVEAGGAVQANSSLSATARSAALEAVVAGDAEFIFLAPEQLAKDEVLEALAEARPSMFVVDEAHCISSWGHDFRPDYLRLGTVVERLGRPRVLALTATASPPVRAEIVERLGMRDPVQLVQGFDRPNLSLDVEWVRTDEQRREAVLLRAMGSPKPGLVYTATRASADAYAAALADLGADAAAYHAGLRAADRTAVQERFMAGELDVVVATTAFGMGIDKADVRFVLHAEVADSLDSYYQEIGRAGRDGEPAEAVLYYRPEDLGLRQFFASGGVDEQALQKVATLVEHAPGPVSPAELAEEMGLSSTRLVGLVNLLEQVAAVEVLPDGRLTGDPVPADAVAAAVAVAESRRRVERSRVDMMRGYAETQGCRRQYLLGYFGERLAQLCGNCDSCLAGAAATAPDPAASPFPLDSEVQHATWGTGVVMSYEGDRITVLFQEEGYKTLSLDAVLANGLLTSGAEQPAAG
jgi:ATP-dependent DNA helicase RecQ